MHLPRRETHVPLNRVGEPDSLSYMAKRIGEIMVALGAMKPDQVESVLVAQRAGDKRLFGTIALSLGYIEDNALRRYSDYLDLHTEGAV